MAFIFLQEDPKVAVGDADDNPLTIPTPEQLGSLLVTTDGTGGNGKIYAAVKTPAPAWVFVGGVGSGVSGGGTPNRVAKFTGPATIGDSQITDVTGGAVTISAATAASMVANNGPATVQALGAGNGAALQAANGTVQAVASGVGNSASLQSTGGPASVVAAQNIGIAAGTGIVIQTTAGSIVASAPATGAVSIQNPNSSVTVGAGGANNNVDIAATGNLQVSVTGNISLNGALFLGSYSVGTLPPGGTQAMAFATDVRNLNSAVAYPGIEAVGTGGLVIRGLDGVWRLSGTNIVAQA